MVPVESAMLSRDAGTRAEFFWRHDCLRRGFDYGRLDTNGVTIPSTAGFGRITNTVAGVDIESCRLALGSFSERQAGCRGSGLWGE